MTRCRRFCTVIPGGLRRQPDSPCAQAASNAASRISGNSAPRVLVTSAKHTWRSPPPFIGNLVSIGESAIQFEFTARAQMHVPSMELGWSSNLIRDEGADECCHAWGALLPFALGWLRARRPPNAPVSFTAHPVPLSGSTSQNSRRPPPRRGREATGPRRPRSRRHGIVSKARPPGPRRPTIRRRRNR